MHQVRSRVIAEANREGLYGMYVTILGAFRPEMACALRVSVCHHTPLYLAYHLASLLALGGLLRLTGELAGA